MKPWKSLLLVVVALSGIAWAAPSDTSSIAAAEAAEDRGNAHKPPVFTPDRRNPELESLRAEVNKLRAEAEMCRAQVAKVPVPPK